jgi:hypothetical protein
MRSEKRAPIAAALLLLLSSCSLFKDAEALDIQRSPTFSATSLAHDGVVIGAVVSSNAERLARESSPHDLASSLHSRFVEERPRTKVSPPGSVELALGAAKYDAFVTFFQKTGDIEVERVPEIRARMHDPVRYLLMARITNDEISTSENSDREFRENKWVTKSINYNTSRATTMLFAVYDLQSSSLEWKGHLKTSNYKTRTVGVDDDGHGNDGDSLFDFLTQVLLEDCEPSGPPFPAPASIQDQTGRIYDEFLATLFEETK